MNIGDTVILESGSPKMTIVGIIKGEAECSWYSAIGNIKYDKYSISKLRSLSAIPDRF